MKKSTYYPYLDYLTIIASLAVVILHTSQSAFNFTPEKLHWWLAIFIQISFIWAVPIFFMISGATLLDYRQKYDTKTFMKKRLLRTVISFVTWSIIWYSLTKHDLNIVHFVKLFTYDKIQPNFWFFYFIIPVYLTLPFVSVFTNKTHLNLVKYGIILYVFGVGIIGYSSNLLHADMPDLIANLPFGITGGIGFFLIGWYLHHYPLNKHLAYGLSVIGGLGLITATLTLSFASGNTIRDAYSIFSIGGILLPIGIWVAVQQVHRPPKHPQLIKECASLSLFVYASHPIIIKIITLLIPNLNNYVQLFILPVITWFCCLLMGHYLKKIKLFKLLLI